MKLILFMLLLISPAAFAQVGETNSVCSVRYSGKMPLDGQGKILLEKQRAILEFEKGLCVSVTVYSQKDRFKEGYPPIPEDVRERLLLKNAGPSQWSLIQETEKLYEWKTADGQRVATYDPKEAILVIKMAPAPATGS